MAKKKVGQVSKLNTVYTYEEALQSFLFFKKAQGISETTLNDYKQHIHRFFTRFSEGWQSPKLKLFIMEYMSDNIKPATFNLRLIYLKAFFDWCLNEGHIDENPLADFKKRKAQERIVDIPEDVLQKLLSLPNQRTFAGLRDYALILFTLDTGIRPKEAFSLNVADFDLKRLLVNIPAEEAKTRTARTLPILPPTAEAIHRLIRSRHCSWDNDKIPVFCSSEGTRFNRYTWGDRLEMYSNQLGVKVRGYDLRHCFALIYLRNGGHAFGLQKMLGHSDMTMTKRYVNLTGNDLQDAHKKASPINRLITTDKKRIRNIG